jgi:aerobic carbon-monoxide dehydrogenase medium subunit
MYAFEYHRPESLSGAVADLANPDAKALAGGMTLLPTMKQRLASPAALIDLKSVHELAGIAREGDNLAIGAMTRHADVARSNVAQAAIPALASLAGIIGDPHVRNMGTIQLQTIRRRRLLSARRSSPTSAALRRKISSPAFLRPRSRPANSSRK